MKPVALLLAGLLMAAPIATAIHAHAATPDETIAMRRANRKRTGELAESIKKALAAGATAQSQQAAVQELDDLAKPFKGWFPAGTETGGGTHALPAIWTERAKFDAAADVNQTAIDRLLVLAKAGDTVAFTAQFHEVGASCGACHRSFKAR